MTRWGFAVTGAKTAHWASDLAEEQPEVPADMGHTRVDTLSQAEGRFFGNVARNRYFCVRGNDRGVRWSAGAAM